MFVTVFLGVVHLPTGRVNYVNAGHNPPLVRHADGQVSVLPSGRNTAVGVMEDLSYVQGAVTLGPGDTLLLYTDGMTEATNPQGLLFGEARLLETARREGSGKALLQAILDAVRAFEDGAAQADDITCVALRYAGMARSPAGDASESPRHHEEV
jgi:sigma-B regulation protein RsbU (phosphoserine phosphatase)